MKSKEVVDQVMSLVKNYGAIALKGNHDFMFVDAMNGGDDGLFLHNGGFHTIESYCGVNWFEKYNGFDWEGYEAAKEYIIKHHKKHIEFLDNLPYYYEDENHVFVHAGLNPIYEDWKEQPIDNFIWIREDFLCNPVTIDKKVIFGHTPTVGLHLHKSSDIWFGDKKIGIDGGCCFGYQMNLLEIIDGEYYEHSVSRGGNEVLTRRKT